MGNADLYVLFELARDFTLQVGLVVGRAYGLILVFPAFTRVQLSQLLKITFAAALSLPMVEAFGPILFLEVDRSVLANVFLVVKEVFIGLALGLFLGLPIWALISAGDIIDNQRELGNADIEDPSSGTSVSAMAALFSFVATTSFFVLGGGIVIAQVIYSSFLFWPINVLAPEFTDGAFLTLVGVLADHLLLAILLAGPFLALSLLSDVTVSALSRASPTMLSFSSAPLIKNLIFSLFLLFYVSVLIMEIDRLLPGGVQALQFFEQGIER